MTELLDSQERTARGTAVQTDVLGQRALTESLLDESWRDYVFAEVWNSPGLDRRARYLIAIAGCVVSKADPEEIDGFVRGALKNEILSVIELREAALHMGPYSGWHCARDLDKSITRIVKELNLSMGETAPIRAEPWDPAVRTKEGATEYNNVMHGPLGPAVTPYLRNIQNFVFGEMWIRRALDERSRRWLTLVGVCHSTTENPIRSHVSAAMVSGNCTIDEMQEFVLQFGVHCGWPKASVVQVAVFEAHAQIQAGNSWATGLDPDEG